MMSTQSSMVPPQTKPNRIAAIDVARGVALIAMASYHFTWDLEHFGYADPGLTAFGAWKIYARCIASTFLFLVGVSLFLAHGNGIRWSGFWKRFAMVAVAALAITAVTWFAVPDGFIFFGILHEIALASLLGLLFLRLPALLTLAVAALVIAAPIYLRTEAFDSAIWWWVGLSPVNPRSNDYVPLFPWFGPVLAGIGVTKLASASGMLAPLAAVAPGRWSRPLALAGQHSLAFYLIHQPVLFGCVWLFSQVMPAPVETQQVRFQKSCQASCQEIQDAEFCERYCGCMLDALDSEGSLGRLYQESQTDELRAHVRDLASTCTATTQDDAIDGGTQ